jgi:hypothetical protein
MDERKPLPIIVTYSEAKRIAYAAAMKHKGCRVGQALCNEYDVPPGLESIIYEKDDITTVAHAWIGYNFTH